ncbi:hypothetical protein ACEI25_001419 [Photobacterium damselae]
MTTSTTDKIKASIEIVSETAIEGIKAASDKIIDSVETTSDKITDGISTISSATSRAGSVVNRVAALDKAGVDHEVIALQITKGSRRGHKYTEQDVQSYSKLYDDAKSGVPMTAKAARALAKDQVKERNTKAKK